ncbi:DEAD/DEAH box helicase [Paenibacillus koleovorans]|uniref:DEAD/DEAH box helicase n=1 Tax=Paenibacillus koleovorans TaxID=121608 RepID=UPI000FD8574F|nr:DEAD/DEAH box helicase [Paenibacillus koleovorans]
MSGLVSVDLIRDVCESRAYEKGYSSYVKGDILSMEAHGDGSFTAMLDGGGVEYEVALRLPYAGDFEAVCSCMPSTGAPSACCPHIAAVLFKVMHSKHNHTQPGAPSQSRPGRLASARTSTARSQPDLSEADRRLSRNILSLFQPRGDAAPSWTRTLAQPKEQLQVEFILSANTIKPDRSQLLLEMKAGPKRLYVVPRIREFLTNVKNQVSFQWSKHFAYDSQVHTFEAADLTMLKELQEVIQVETAYNHAFHGSYYSSSRTYGNERHLFLPPEAWSKLGPLLCRMPNVKFQTGSTEYKGIQIVDDEFPLKMELSKPTSSYYQLDIHGMDRLQFMENYGYVLKEGRLLRMKPAHIRKLIDLYNTLVAHSSGHRSYLHQVQPVHTMRIDAEDIDPSMSTLLRGFKSIAHVTVAKSISDRIVDAKLQAKVYLDREDDCIWARVEYVYDEVPFDPLAESAVGTAGEGVAQQEERMREAGVSRIVMRDAEQERRVLGVLEGAGFRREGRRLRLQEEDEVYEFLYHVLPVLETMAAVYATSSFRPMIERLTTAPRVSVELNERTQWLEVKFDLSGIEESSIRHVLRTVVEKKRYARLPNGAFLSLEDAGFKELGRVLGDLGVRHAELTGARMQLPLARGLQLLARGGPEGATDAGTGPAGAGLAGANPAGGGTGMDTNAGAYGELQPATPQPSSLKLGRAFRQLLDNLRHPDQLDHELPALADGPVRAYQAFGFQWMKTLAYYRFGGILADDMGLGKTIQSIAYLLSEHDRIREAGQPTLIVCPASLVYNWRNELARFAPTLRTAVVAGAKPERNALLQSLHTTDVVITSYPLIRRDLEDYAQVTFHTLILDEAQAIKNHSTQTAQAVRALQAQQRFALTGTPIENSLEELWSIFDAVFPELFGGKNQFHELTREQVARRVRPFILRRLKRDVLQELPDKIETLQASELTDEQKTLYMAFLAKLREETVAHLNDGSFNKNRIRILAGLTRLRQLVLHPALFVDGYTGGSGKLEQLLELVEEALAAGKRLLLFSQFTGMLGIIRHELERRGESCFYLDGQTPAAERVELCRRFNEGEQDIFLLSLKAGGTGLNLTGADTVILYDLWWNPAVEQQAADRAHRIGQRNTVHVIRLVAQGTLEEKMYELQRKKLDLVDTVIQSGEESFGSLTEEDVRELLGV